MREWIISETEDWIAINKPAGLLSIPDRQGKEESLKKLLEEKKGKIFTVHRLDRDTSGVIVFAKNELSHKHLSLQFESHETIKIYQGLVNGIPAEKTGTIEAPIMEHPVKKGVMVVHRNGKTSKTDYEIIEVLGKYSFLKFRIYTGRTHQIRVHMKNLGHPIVCDEVYGDGRPILLSSIKKNFNLSKKEDEERPMLGRLALHSLQLTFYDVDSKPVLVEAPLAKDLKATIIQLRKNG